MGQLLDQAFMMGFRKHRIVFLVAALAATMAVIAPLFLIAGCRTLQQTPQELRARETLRAMTRGGVLPGEDAVARIEADYPRTTAGALASMVHARIKLKANDFTGAATLLDSSAPVKSFAFNLIRACTMLESN